MDDDLDPVAHLNGGYLFRHQLNGLGISDDQIRRSVRAGTLKRVRHGTYVPAALWSTATDVERAAIVARSVLDKLGPGVAASHQTASILHDHNVFGIDLGVVHVTRLDGRSGRREAGVRYHEGSIDPERDLCEVDVRLVVEAVRATLESCSTMSIESGMVVASSALREKDVLPEELEEGLLQMDHWPGVRTARVAIRLADGRLESVGEVRSLHMMWQQRIPRPELQHEFWSDGRLIARSDFYWTVYRHVGEFDGLIKYGRLNPNSADPGIVVADEKVREDAVRGLDNGMSRWIWNELEPFRRPRMGRVLVQAMERSRRLYTRNATHIA